jgi:hypothetical protein
MGRAMKLNRESLARVLTDGDMSRDERYALALTTLHPFLDEWEQWRTEPIEQEELSSSLRKAITAVNVHVRRLGLE